MIIWLEKDISTNLTALKEKNIKRFNNRTFSYFMFKQIIEISAMSLEIRPLAALYPPYNFLD